MGELGLAGLADKFSELSDALEVGYDIDTEDAEDVKKAIIDGLITPIENAIKELSPGAKLILDGLKLYCAIDGEEGWLYISIGGKFPIMLPRKDVDSSAYLVAEYTVVDLSCDKPYPAVLTPELREMFKKEKPVWGFVNSMEQGEISSSLEVYQFSDREELDVLILSNSINPAYGAVVSSVLSIFRNRNSVDSEGILARIERAFAVEIKQAEIYFTRISAVLRKIDSIEEKIELLEEKKRRLEGKKNDEAVSKLKKLSGNRTKTTGQ